MEQPCSWLAVRGASRWIPSFNPLFCISLCSWFHPNCHDQSQLPSKSAGKSPLSHIGPFPNMLCHSPGNGSSVVSAVLRAQRKLWSSLPFYTEQEFLPWAAPSRQSSPACAEHSPHHSKQDECFHAFPSLCDSFTNSASHFHMMNLNRVQEKDPSSWSWTEPQTSEWGRLALYLASSFYLLKEPGMQDWNP